MTVTSIFNFLCLELYCALSATVEDTYTGFTGFKVVFEGLKAYFLKAIPSAFICCLSWWHYEVLIIFAGILGKEQLAAFAIVTNLSFLAFDISYAIACSSSTFVSFFLRIQEAELAKKYSRYALLFSLISMMLICLLLFAAGSALAAMYTNIKEVADAFKSVVCLAAIHIFIDSIQNVINSVLRGLGLGTFGFVFTIFAYYFVGVPLAVKLAFFSEMGFPGLLLAQVTAAAILSVIVVLIMQCSDWKKLND